MCTFGAGFKLQDRAVGTVLVRIFSNFQDKTLEWILTEHKFRICNFNVLRSGQFSTRSNNPMEEITIPLITFEPKVMDESNWYRSVYLVVPNRMIPIMTNFDLTWTVTPGREVKF